MIDRAFEERGEIDAGYRVNWPSQEKRPPLTGTTYRVCLGEVIKRVMREGPPVIAPYERKDLGLRKQTLRMFRDIRADICANSLKDPAP